MQPEENIQPTEDQSKPFEVVIGVFETHEDASRVAASLRGPDVQVRKVSRNDPAAPDQLPEIVYEDLDQVQGHNVAKGTMLGGAIGFGSGLIFLAVPGLNVAAPIAGGLVGAWIGGVAGIDEAKRGVELPNAEDYRQMLAAGKSFVVIAGDESTRAEYGKKMAELGAEEVHQHPPIGQVIRS